jgi:hypothetical protein
LRPGRNSDCPARGSGRPGRNSDRSLVFNRA